MRDEAAKIISSGINNELPQNSKRALQASDELAAAGAPRTKPGEWDLDYQEWK